MRLSLDNPFRPDAGVFPPLRAGHEKAAAYLAWRLGLVQSGKEGGAVILHGPRGNGKTALLAELCKTAAGGKGRVIELDTHDMVGDSVTLASVLAAETAGVWPRIKGAGVSLFDAGARLALGRSPEISAGKALRRYLRKPLLLMVDEAHEMPVGLGKVLLQATQDCVDEGLPLLAVLAGTPGLPTHLGEMHASFRERCTELRIGRLENDKAAGDALARPARDSGMPVDADALESLVEESQRYPFFVQELGFESWNAAHARGGTRRITLEDADKGIAAVNEKLQTFYDERRGEIRKRGVLGEAEAVSRLVDDRGRDARLTTSELMAAVEGVATPGGRDPDESLRSLAHLGVVWKTPRLDWEPGIPSLCSFLVRWEGARAS